MVKKTQTPYQAALRRQGAKAGVAAIVKLEDAISKGGNEGRYYAIDPVEAGRIMSEGAGEKLSPRMEGYLAALGEYIGQICEGFCPAPTMFNPLAAMTEKEVAAERAGWNLYMTVTSHLPPPKLADA